MLAAPGVFSGPRFSMSKLIRKLQYQAAVTMPFSTFTTEEVDFWFMNVQVPNGNPKFLPRHPDHFRNCDVINKDDLSTPGQLWKRQLFFLRSCSFPHRHVESDGAFPSAEYGRRTNRTPLFLIIEQDFQGVEHEGLSKNGRIPE